MTLLKQACYTVAAEATGADWTERMYQVVIHRRGTGIAFQDGEIDSILDQEDGLNQLYETLLIKIQVNLI